MKIFMLVVGLIFTYSTAFAAPTDRKVTIEYTEPSASVCAADTYITGVQSGLVISQVSPDSTELQPTETGNAAQRWEMIKLPNGSFNLKNAQSGLCAGIRDSSTTLGELVTLLGCTADANMTWQIGPSPSTLKPLHNLAMCANIPGNSTEAGAKIQQYPCTTAPNELFSYTAHGSVSCELDDLASTRIYQDVGNDGDPGIKIDVPATAKTGGGKISKTMCVPIKDDATAEGIHFQVSAIDESGNESEKTPEVVWPVNGTRTCAADITPPGIPENLEIHHE